MKLTDSKAIHLYRAQIALQPTLSALSGCKQNWRFATPAKQLRYTWISLYFKGFVAIRQGEKRSREGDHSKDTLKISRNA